MFEQIKRRLKWFSQDIGELIAGLKRLRANPEMLDTLIDIGQKFKKLVLRLLGVLTDAPATPPVATAFNGDPGLTLSASWDADKRRVLGKFFLDARALPLATRCGLVLRSASGETLDEISVLESGHNEATFSAKSYDETGRLEMEFFYESQSGAILEVTESVEIPPQPQTQPQTPVAVFDGDPELGLSLSYEGAGVLRVEYRVKKAALEAATIAGVVVKTADLVTLDNLDLAADDAPTGTFQADLKGATGKIKTKFYYRAAGRWHNAVKWITVPAAHEAETPASAPPPLRGGPRVGINAAWIYHLDREPSNIFERESLVLKPGFIADMSHLDVFRFMNLNNVNHSDLAGDASVIATPDDLLNRRSAGWRGSMPGMNPDLIVRVANEANVIPWVNLTHNSLLEGHEEFVRRWAVALQKSTADRVVVELSNEPWNNAGPFKMQTLAFADYAAEHLSLGGTATGTNEWGRWASPAHSMAGALYFLGQIDRLMRPILGDKLVTVWNSQSVKELVSQWPQIIDQVDYSPDMVAIATYYSAPQMNMKTATAQLPTLVRRWDHARKIADQCGVMLAAYESGSEAHHNNAENRAWVVSNENGQMLEQLFSHICGVADYAVTYMYAYRDQFGILREPGKSTPAWDGFLRGISRTVAPLP